MKLKLFIVLFVTALGAIITVGCNHDQNSENSGESPANSQPSMSATNLANTNSVGSVNTPSITSTNNVPMTNNP
jgi:hypothetical protein